MKNIDDTKLKKLVEAALFIADKPLTVAILKTSLLADYSVSSARIKAAIAALEQDYKTRGVELIKVASGYRFQTHHSISDDLGHLYKEKTPKYSRALLETLALIAYKQPITRGEIEEVRGVGVSSYIMKTLTERNWVKVVGQKEVPGRPVLYATTKEFLDYFNLSSLAELPDLMPIPELSLDDNLTPIKETET
ncbi:SMC-Scp complex subunit ScpB [Thalassotalea sp. PLHSN55]|uniref:SMC-Scp complex subunit ScpB n=1 Tax=Thalassotalea sp. PLHSN55 TaxID=3435888 RepID=UPI003F841402